MFLFIRNFGVGEIAVILLLALIVFGPKKLPEIGKSLGRSINEFKKSISTDEDDKKTPEATKAEIIAAIKEETAATKENTGAVDSNEEK